MGLAAAFARLFEERAIGTALVPAELPPLRREPEPPPLLLLPPLPANDDHADDHANGAPRADFRHISPRRFAELTHELYVEGLLSWEEFRTIGVPCELHPDYDQTIGALTGEKAEPDRPRDMLAQWEQRLEFENRFNPGTPTVALIERVVALLERLSPQSGRTVQPWLSGPWPEPRPGALSIARRT